MRSLLVTGGAGFMGSHFVHYWAEHHAGDRLVVLDALTYAGNRTSLANLEASGRVVFVHGDVCDRELVSAVLRAHDVTTVVHFAAESHVDRSIASADAFVRTNVWGTQVLLDAVRDAWCEQGAWRSGVRFHQISTDEVYGDLAPGAAPFTEASLYRPSSPYSASKAAADHFVRAAGRTHGLPYSISHCANNYGPRQYPEKLIPLMLTHALHGKPLPIYGSGLQQREWIYVNDHSAAVESILLADVAGESFNIGSGRECTNLELVRALCAELDARFAADAALRARYPECPAARGSACAALVTHVADRPGHDMRYALDATKLRERVGWRAAESLETGLRRTVEAFLSGAGAQ
ncbi:MAG: dTDP-glucose 4,6-dehydratase [Gemmatimonadaceae bacterium]|nr:dTDP-glucose 4,6-dehydratase [Gemmatimonadaceae bacterium]